MVVEDEESHSLVCKLKAQESCSSCSADLTACQPGMLMSKSRRAWMPQLKEREKIHIPLLFCSVRVLNILTSPPCGR